MRSGFPAPAATKLDLPVTPPLARCSPGWDWTCRRREPTRTSRSEGFRCLRSATPDGRLRRRRHPPPHPTEVSSLLGLYTGDCTLHHVGVVASLPKARRAALFDELRTLVVLDSGGTGRGRGRRPRDLPGFAFGPSDVLERIARLGDLFAPVLTLHQELPHA